MDFGSSSAASDRRPAALLFFMVFFVLGFAQGTIRRLIGIASILFSFLFAAKLRSRWATSSRNNWTQFSDGVQPT